MAENPCIAAAKSVGGQDLTDAQLEDILALLDAKAARVMREEPSISEAAAYQRAATEVKAERKLEILIARRQRAINAMAHRDRLKMYDSFTAEGMPIRKQLLALTVGVEGDFKGAGRSVDALTHGLEDQLYGPMLSELDSSGVLKAAQLKDLEFESTIAHEMARLNGDTTIKPTQDKYAAKVAEIFVKYTEHARHLQNQAGAYIRKLPGYITRQMHDQVAIYRAGMDQWVEKIKPLLDPRTFDGITDVDAYLRETWANLSSGNHEKASGGANWMAGFEGTGNLAKRASAERVLHFRDPASWLAYNNEFGRKSLFESVYSGLGYAARNTAIMRVFGTNPEAAFKADINRLTQVAKKSGDLKSMRALEGQGLKNAFQEVYGGSQVGGDPTVAMWGSSMRTVANMASLGGVVVSSLPDMCTRAAVLQHNGVPIARAWTNNLDAMFHGLQLPEEKARAAKVMHSGVQGMIGGIFHRFTATDSTPGKLLKANNAFFKYTLLTGWTDGWTRWFGITLASHMGDLAKSGKAFDELDIRHQATLRRHDIGRAEWDALRQAEIFDADGSGLLMADKVQEIPDTAAVEYWKATRGKGRIPKDLSKIKQDLSLKLSSYYAMQAREAMTVGGAKERAMMKLGFGVERGTVIGELLAMIMQFKLYSVTFVTKHLNREFNRSAKGVDKVGVGHLLAGTTLLGFTSLYLDALSKGQKLEEPEDAAGYARLMAESMIKGGSAGIIGDTLYGAATGGSNRLLKNIAGPVIGKTVLPAADILQAAANGQDPSAKALKAGLGIIPYNNLFYTRLGLDYMLLNGLQETLDPGYLRRYERMMERDHDRGWWLPPTSSMNQ